MPFPSRAKSSALASFVTIFLFGAFAHAAPSKMKCSGEDLNKTYNVECEVAYQGITDDSENYYQELEAEDVQCGAAKPSVGGNAGMLMSMYGQNFRAEIQILNHFAAMWVQPSGGHRTYVKMSPESLTKDPLTLQVQLDQNIETANGDLIQDMILSCRLAK